MMRAQVPVDDGTLRDDLNLMWPPQATIMDELSKYDELPKIVLISRIRPVSGTEDPENDLPPSKKGNKKSNFGMDLEEFDGLESDSDDSDSSEINA